MVFLADCSCSPYAVNETYRGWGSMQVVFQARINDLADILCSRIGEDRTALRQWVRRSIRRHIMHSPEWLERIADAYDLDECLKRDGILEYPERHDLILKFSRGEAFWKPVEHLIPSIADSALATIDWLLSLPPDDRHIRRIDRMSWAEAQRCSHAWHASLARTASYKRIQGDLETGTKMLAQFKGGVRMVELHTDEALKVEGAAMGHCVGRGGYIERIARGETRVLSLRDENGEPHVTIELGRPRSIEIKGLGSVKVAKPPTDGISQIEIVSSDWVVVQIRGKGNREPVQKWQRFVDRFLAAHPEFSSGAGHSSESADMLSVYSVLGRHYADPEEAIREGEFALLKRMKGDPGPYEISGLVELHSRFPNPSASDEFFRTALRRCVDQIMASPMHSLTNRIFSSGMPLLLRSADLRMTNNFEAIVDELFRYNQQIAGPATVPFNLVVVPYVFSVACEFHYLPLLPLAILAAELPCKEHRTISVLKPLFASVLSAVMADPSKIHVILPAEGASLPPDVLHRAFLACGLESELAEASEAVAVEITAIRNEMNRVMGYRDSSEEGPGGDDQLFRSSDEFLPTLSSLLAKELETYPYVVGATPRNWTRSASIVLGVEPTPPEMTMR